MRWTAEGHGRWPSSPSGEPLDDAAGRLARLVFFEGPRELRSVALRFGMLAYAGAPPATYAQVAAVTGMNRTGLRLCLQSFEGAARAGGAPPSLVAAVRILDGAVPASAPRCALTLVEEGLTTGVLHPETVRLLATAWGLPRPAWHRDIPKGVPSLFVGAGWPAQRLALGRLALSIRRAGIIGLAAAEAAIGNLLIGLAPGQAVDLLTARGLHTPGSPVVWDHTYPGSRLVTVLAQMITAVGPLDPVTAASSLTRNPTGPLPVTGAHIAALAREHPWLRMTAEGRVDTRPNTPGCQVLPPRDRAVIGLLRRRDGSGSTGELRDRLVGRGVFPSQASAESFLYARPYLRSPRPGVVALLAAAPPATPSDAFTHEGSNVSELRAAQTEDGDRAPAAAGPDGVRRG